MRCGLLRNDSGQLTDVKVAGGIAAELCVNMETARKAPRGYQVTALVMGAFGLLTLVASSAVLFNVGGAREAAGAIVLLVLWMNFGAAFLYIIAAFGLFRLQPWAPFPVLLAALLLFVAAIGFLVHVQQGGPYEARTIGALAFRIAVTVLLYLAARYFVRPSNR